MKKNKRLALQVSAIVTLMFILIIAFIGFIIVTITKKMYLELNNKKISHEVEEYKDLFMNTEIADWVLDQWCEHPEDMKAPCSDITEDIYGEIMYASNYARFVDKESLESVDPEVRTAFLKALYDYNVTFFQEKRDNGEFEEMYCVDVRNYDNVYKDNKDDIYIYFYCDRETGENGDHGLGEVILSRDEYTIFKTLQNGTYGVDYGDLVTQELKVDSFDKLYYLTATPVFIDDELRYALVFVYDWSSFAHILNVNLNYIIIWGGIGLVVTNALLILFIYIRAVRPTVQVNAGVREYMKTKDSAEIVRKMTAVGQKNEIGRLADSISDLAVEMDQYALDIARLTGEKERVEAELNLAAKIQIDMLPKKFPDIPEVKLSAAMFPAKEVGGDFYDFFFIDDTHLGLVIADVSGKGIPAALFMMMSMMIIKSSAMSAASPADVLKRANESICDNNKNKMFVTVWFGILDITTGHVTAANAGHEYPMLRKADGSFEMMKEKHGMFLGVFRNNKYKQYEFDIEPGGTLFVYTDGAAEATNGELKLFGTERMLGALNAVPDAGPEDLIGNMKSAIDEFVGEAPQFDDLTMLCIKYNGKQQTEEPQL